MDTTIRNVRDIDSDERRVYETALGQKLQENQQVLLHVITLASEQPAPGGEDQPAKQPCGQLPDWCNVYEGLSDEEIEDIEKVILDRSGWTRNPH
jgi:hypothetical protein